MQPSQSFTATQDLAISGLKSCRFPANQEPSSSHVVPTSLESAELAHDAGNLLSALSLYAELLASPGVLSKRYRSYAEEIKVLADRSNVLIERLAGYRRVSTLGPQEVVLPLLVEDYKGLLSKVVGRPIEVTIGPFAYQPIAVSREAVERVLLNLTKNAAAATLPSDSLRINVEGSRPCDTNGSRYVLLTVTDDGSGMSRKELETLFESAALRNETGHGFGLRIVRELVEESSGQLDIESYPGRGTRVSVKWSTPQIDTHRCDPN